MRPTRSSDVDSGFRRASPAGPTLMARSKRASRAIRAGRMNRSGLTTAPSTALEKSSAGLKAGRFQLADPLGDPVDRAIAACELRWEKERDAAKWRAAWDMMLLEQSTPATHQPIRTHQP